MKQADLVNARHGSFLPSSPFLDFSQSSSLPLPLSSFHLQLPLSPFHYKRGQLHQLTSTPSSSKPNNGPSTMADQYPEDMADVATTFTPINAHIKSEAVGDDTVLKTEYQVKDEQDDDVSPSFSNRPHSIRLWCIQAEHTLSSVPPVTPQKRGKKSAEPGSSAKKAKATPTSSTKKAASIPIPNSFEEAGPEDRMLLHLRDKDNKQFSEIAKKWNIMTGASTTAGSLKSRYQRIKAKFVTFDPDHVGSFVLVPLCWFFSRLTGWL